jgi:hypothetical protein
MPDGGICFISTRCERGILCDPPDILTTTVLYRMDADGRNIRELSKGAVSEEVPSIMPDGRILYTRWEYVDKGGSAVKCLWAMRPDGSGSVEIFGNDHAFPSFYNGRSIPGSHNLFVAIGGPHMPLGVGTVLRIDTTEDIKTRAPITYITPDIDIQSEWGYRHRIDGEWVPVQSGPLYDDPYPLSKDFFLVSHNANQDVHHVSAYDLYALDSAGNRQLIYDDPTMSCWEPVPLRTRPIPPIIPSVSQPGAATATILLTDVYRGLEEIPRGTIKYVRVCEQVPRSWDARRYWDGDEHGQQHSVISLWAHTYVKLIHGIVPVEKDGSAYFKVPANRNIFFQALDKDFMEIQRMRTFVDFLPDESRSCIGCHEGQRLAPYNGRPLALENRLRLPEPQPGDTGPRAVDYAVDVQPILDRNCIECHSGEDPEAALDLSGILTAQFNQSYENLMKRGMIKVVSEIGQKMGNVDATPPYTWGSHASQLITALKQKHPQVKLTKEEWIRLVTWVDSNAPYYGTYYGRKNLKYKNHPDFRPTPDIAMGTN